MSSTAEKVQNPIEEIPCPISNSCLKNLNDKVYEKRKSAALDIQKLVKNLVITDDFKAIQKLIQVLRNDCILSHYVNSRKGGCIGLAATAIGLEKHISNYVANLIEPVITCLYDSDNGVRYFACEALFNIVKVCRSALIADIETFKEVFSGLGKISCDIDQNVRNGSEPLDRLVKDIVIENYRILTGILPKPKAQSEITQESNDILFEALIDMLKDMIYTKNSFGRNFVVSWLALINDITGKERNKIILYNLPKYLDGLLLILDDENPPVKKACQNLLDNILKEIVDIFADKTSQNFEDVNSQEPTDDYISEHIDGTTLINILIIHCKSNIKSSKINPLKYFNVNFFMFMPDESVQEIALNWIKAFVMLLPPQDIFPFFPILLTAILPCLKATPKESDFGDHINLCANDSPEENLFKSMGQSADTINKTLLNLIITWGKPNSTEQNHTNQTNKSNQTVYEQTNGNVVKHEEDIDQNSLLTDKETAGKTVKTPKDSKISFIGNKIMSRLNRSQSVAVSKNLLSDAANAGLDIRNMISILLSHMQNQPASESTRLAVLNWISKLFEHLPHKMSDHIGEIFPVLMHSLLDPSDEVVLVDIRVMAQICCVDSDKLLSFSKFFTEKDGEGHELSSLEKSNLPNYHMNHFMEALIDLFLTKFMEEEALKNNYGPNKILGDSKTLFNKPPKQLINVLEPSSGNITPIMHNYNNNINNKRSNSISISNTNNPNLSLVKPAINILPDDNTIKHGGNDIRNDTKLLDNNELSQQKWESFFDSRSIFIVRKLCLYVCPYDIYINMAKILSHLSEPKVVSDNLKPENDNQKQTSTYIKSSARIYLTEPNKLKFLAKMVHLMNTILMTTPELYTLRNDLKSFPNGNQKSLNLFLTLYHLWCHNAIATLSLCLLTQNFAHAYHVLQTFSTDYVPVTLDFLVEIDKLIQLLESPIFMFVRLKLLEPESNTYLVKTLYGLLMILPQSSAFKALNERLKCLPQLYNINHQNSLPSKISIQTPLNPSVGHDLNFDELLEEFRRIQNLHSSLVTLETL